MTSNKKVKKSQPQQELSGSNLDNLEFWMTNLPQKLRQLPIIYLAIPGSHNSMTYAITRKSGLSPDIPPAIGRFKFLGPLFSAVMVKWSKTQLLDVPLQLAKGVRYFDLRIATKTGTDKFYFVHGLYASEVAPALEQVRVFLDSHPKEVVFLDCQHFYAFEQGDHDRLMRLIHTTFWDRMTPSTPTNIEYLSLDSMTTKFRYQAIVIYRSHAAIAQPMLWPAMCFPTPWPDTVSIPHLIRFLDEKLMIRPAHRGFVSQCILTPSSWFVVKHLFSSLMKQCVLPLEKAQYEWLVKQKPGGPKGINIVICDFVDVKEGLFAKEVVSLNAKLLESLAYAKGDEKKKLYPVD